MHKVTLDVLIVNKKNCIFFILGEISMDVASPDFFYIQRRMYIIMVINSKIQYSVNYWESLVKRGVVQGMKCIYIYIYIHYL